MRSWSEQDGLGLQGESDMSKKRETWVLRLQLPSDRPLPPVIDIWLNPATQRWCIGPPRPAKSAAIMLAQIDPNRFFTTEGGE